MKSKRNKFGRVIVEAKVFEMTRAPAVSERLLELLAKGWEPFAVTSYTESEDEVYFRRLVAVK